MSTATMEGRVWIVSPRSPRDPNKCKVIAYTDPQKAIARMKYMAGFDYGIDMIMYHPHANQVLISMGKGIRGKKETSFCVNGYDFAFLPAIKIKGAQ